MKLYKVVRYHYDHSVSVFEPEPLDPLPYMGNDHKLLYDQIRRIMLEPGWIVPDPVPAGDPIRRLVLQLKQYGLTEAQGYKVVSGWAHHAKYNHNQSPRGVRIFCEMALAKLPRPEMLPDTRIYPFVLLAALTAAVIGALYLWIKLDDEQNLVTSGHEWMYLMTYEERVWIAEVLKTNKYGRGTYEHWGDLGDGLVWVERNSLFIERILDKIWFNHSLIIQGRPTVFYHRFSFSHFDAFYCGRLFEYAPNRYALEKTDNDPYLPGRSWSRPGGPMGTPEYEGCWRDWPWYLG